MPTSRLVQVFLSQSTTPGPSIFEVSSDLTNENLYCTCPGYKARDTCKHIKFVKTRIDENNGSYPLEISDKATKAEADFAKASDDNFREFIIKYGKIEVY